MVTITFPDKKTRMKALGFLVTRFSGKLLRSGEHFLPEEALMAWFEKTYRSLSRDRLPRSRRRLPFETLFSAGRV